MNPSDRDPAAPDAAADAAPPEAAPPVRTPETASPETAPLTPWLASAEGLVPPVPRAHGQWTPEPGPDPDLDLTATRLQPPPPTAADDWGWRPPTEVPAPAPPVPKVPAARSSASAGPNPYVASTGAVDGRATWSESPAGRGGAAPPPSRPVQPPPLVIDRGEAWAIERRGFPVGRLLLAFVLGLVLAVVVAGGALYAYDQQYVGRILPGVRVGSLDLSGLPVAVARDRIAQDYASVSQGSVVVRLGDQTTEIPYAAFNRRVDANRVAIEAFAVGRAAAPVDRLLGEIRTLTRGVTLEPTVILDAGVLEARVREIAHAAEREAVDATAVVTATGFATTPSAPGQTVDEGTAAADAAKQLGALDAPNRLEVTLTPTTVPPAVSDTSAQLASSQAALMNNDVVLADGAERWTIPAATVHRWLTFTVINDRVRIAIDAKAVLADVKPLAADVDRSPVNATVALKGSAVIFAKPSVNGRTLDASKTTSAVVAALRNRALKNLAVDAPIAPVLTVTKPALTTEAAKAAAPKMKAISSWTTNYQPSERNGNGANIRIPTSKISGYVVAPGETFSFWKAVGPVTKEEGYTQGGAIIDGHTEPQGAIGGGICSCSTTLFNAALRAGYDMGARLNHFYYINRYPLGLDATVFISASGQAQDMSWTNDSAFPVVIQGINGKTSVKFVLYSVPNGRTTTFTDPIVKNYTKAHTETRVDKTIPKGTRKQIEYATDGQDVWVTRTVKDASGTVLHKETFYSHYATITGIILTNP